MPMLVCSCGKFVFLEGKARSVPCPQCGEEVAAGRMGGASAGKVRVSAKRGARVKVRHRGDMFLSNLLDTMPRSSPVRWWWLPVGVAQLAAAVPAAAKLFVHGFVVGAELAAAGLFAAAGASAVTLAAFDARPAWRAWIGVALAFALLSLQHRNASLEASYLVAASLPVLLAFLMGAHLAASHVPDSAVAGRLGLWAGAAFAAAAGAAAYWMAAENPDGAARWLAERWPAAAIAAAFLLAAVAAVANRFRRSRALARTAWWIGVAAAAAALALAALGDLARFAAVWAPPALLCVSVAEAAIAPHIPKP
jgi:hypothetical protein